MNPTSCWIRGWSSCASLARSSASCQFPANHSIRAWAARTCARRCSSPRAAAFVSDLVEQRASSIQLPLAGQAPAERHGRALVVLQLKSQPLLDLHAALDETGGEVAGTALCDRNVPNHDGDQCGVTYALGLLESRAGVDERRVDVCLEDPDPAPVPEDPRLPHLVLGGIGERLVQALDRRLRVGL